MYRTGDLTVASQELIRIAAFQDNAGDPPSTRYAVAIWPVNSGDPGSHIVWIGIVMYPSAFWEFIDKHFTDDRPYRNDWKKLVAPACRNTN